VPTWEPGWEVYTTENILNPPLNEFGFPLEIGKEWQSCSNLTQTISVNGFSNNSYTTKMCRNFTCTGKTDVETDIGIFPSYIIKSWTAEQEGEPFIYEVSYYSPLAGNIVKTEEYQYDDICKVLTLKAFSYHDRTHGEEENDMPAFELTSLIIAMVAIVLLSQKRLGDRNAK
jgi:hypothetical protein